MKTLTLHLTVQFFLLLRVLSSSCASDKRRPHIIVIVADDLGWNDVSFHGSGQIPTPNLDALAADGLQMDSYYVNPICTPSRSALLSGYYPIHTGLQHDVIYAEQPYGMPLNVSLLPLHLKKLGYATHAVGKWHLGFFKKDYTPIYRGFDSHYGYWLGHEGYFDHTGNEFFGYGLDLRDNMDVDWNKGGRYATELFTEKAIAVIKQHNASKPLFLYLCHLAVHAGNGYSPLESPPKYTARFPHIKDIKRRLFAGMMSALDDSVGQVVRALSEARLLQDSVILFTTDNGGAAGGLDQNAGTNWPLRGTKATLWEGGVRGVCILWSPLLTTTPGAANKHLMHIIDWMPTLYSAAGGDPSELGSIDGMSMWQSFVGGLSGKSDWPRSEILLNIDPVWKMAAIRKDNYKVVTGRYPGKFDSWYGPSGRDKDSEEIFHTLPEKANQSMVAQTLRRVGRNFTAPSLDWYISHNVTCPPHPLVVGPGTCPDPTKEPCLFDLKEDPCETRDIAKEQPDVLSQLLSLLERYNATSVAPRNKPADPNADPKYHNFTWTTWMDEKD